MSCVVCLSKLANPALFDAMHGNHQYNVLYYKIKEHHEDFSIISPMIYNNDLWAVDEFTTIYKNYAPVSEGHPPNLWKIMVNRNGIFLLYHQEDDIKIIHLDFSYHTLMTYNYSHVHNLDLILTFINEDYILICYDLGGFNIIDTNTMDNKAVQYFDASQFDLLTFDQWTIYYSLQKDDHCHDDSDSDYSISDSDDSHVIEQSNDPTVLYKFDIKTEQHSEIATFPDRVINIFCYQSKLHGYSISGLYVLNDNIWQKLSDNNRNDYHGRLYPMGNYMIGERYVDGKLNYLKLKMTSDVINETTFVDVYGCDDINPISCPVHLLMGSESYDTMISNRWTDVKISFPFGSNVVKQWIKCNTTANPSIYELIDSLLCQTYICHQQNIINETLDKILIKLCMNMNDFIGVFNMDGNVVEMIADQLATAMSFHADELKLCDYQIICSYPGIVMASHQKSHQGLKCADRYKVSKQNNNYIIMK